MDIYNISKMKNINFSTLMKLKSNLLLAAFIIVLFLCIGVSTQAQGIYSVDTNEKKENNTESTPSEESGGLFKAGPGSDVDADPDGDDIPIGEGILILSFLSGTYALVKRNLKRKHEN